MTSTEPVDPCRCPLCGAPNGCAMAAEAASPTSGPCWCTLEKFSARLLAQVPEAARRKACICRACAQADRSGILWERRPRREGAPADHHHSPRGRGSHNGAP